MAGYDLRVTGGKVFLDRGEEVANGEGLCAVLDGYFRPVADIRAYSTTAKALLDWHRDSGQPLEGSFSAVIHDQQRNVVTLVTDRFGTRPLYYFLREGYLHTATRLADLVNEPESLTIPADALSESRALGFVRAPNTLISGIRRVPRNARITVDLNTGEESCEPFPDPLINHGPKNGTLGRLKTEVRTALEQECTQLAKQAESVAILLSGGIDSSILAAIASDTFKRCIAYSCEIEGFDNPELERARFVAEKLGIEHRVVKLRRSALPQLFDEMVDLTEGPSRHINNLVTLCLFKEIKGVDVILGGDGADALFGSGNQQTVFNLEKKLRVISKLPVWIRKITGSGLQVFSNPKLSQLRKLLTRDLDWFTRQVFVIEYPLREEILANRLGLSPNESIQAAPKQSDSAVGRSIEVNFELFLNSMLIRNSQLSSMTGAPLCYPFLTDAMIALSKQVPDSLRFDEQGNAKPVLRALCDDLLGPAVTGWPKMGFVTPEKTWLDNDLSEKLDRLYSNTGGLGKLLGWNLKQQDIETLKRSTRLLWWLLTLDESLLGFKTLMEAGVSKASNEGEPLTRDISE